MATETQHRLDVACRVTQALVECVSEGAASLVEDLELPTAQFAADGTPPVVNAAWRALFGARDVVGTRVGEVARTGVAMHVAELELTLGGRRVYCAALLRRSGPIANPRVIAVCLDISDLVIARQLGVGPAALVWGGNADQAADYASHSWLAYVAPTEDWTQAIHVDDVASCTESLTSAIRTHGAADLEVRVRRADGVYRWHRVRFTSLASRWYATAVDNHEAHVERTDLLDRVRAARADAELSSRLKDQFLAVVSHELRAPLTTIVLWEAVLRDETASADLRVKALEAIRQSALAQSRVVGDLLDISRAIAGKLHIDHHDVDLSAVVRAAIDAHRPVAEAKQIKLAYHERGTASHCDGDEVRLRQVFDNLLSNAIKFTEPGGTVDVALSNRGRSLVIEVADSGRGIAAELLPRLFDPFIQSDDVMTRGAGGLGLGLAISRQLVMLHSGTLIATSAGPGHGATLTMTLPAAFVRAAKPPAAFVRATGLAQTRVLVIDDDQRVREALGLLLDRAGAVVATAASADAGRARIAAEPFDVLVCDIAMPGEDGYTFIRQLRASPSTVPAIALTAYATEGDAGKALAAGFDRHLAKPIDFERLAASIEELARHGTSRMRETT